MEPKKVNVLEVGIDDVSLNQVLEIVKGWLNKKSNKKRYIVTPNPEFIMAAREDLTFRDILNKADLAIPDGAGLKLSGKIKNTTPGVDLTESLCRLSAEKKITVGFLGGRNGVAKKAAGLLRKKYPKIKITYAEDGPTVDKNGDEVVLTVNDKYKKLKTDIIFVGFGHVKQEKWISKNLDKIPVKVAIGVGGAFDYLSGKIKRAPDWMKKLGLEWLFRLVIQPWRIKRQLQLLKFLLLVKKS